jgi:hypothetical protein
VPGNEGRSVRYGEDIFLDFNPVDGRKCNLGLKEFLQFA